MNNFKGGGFKKGGAKFGGKKSFGGDKKYGGGQHRENRTSGPTAELFSATCSECHKKCEVPFKPSGDKPVYCSACFGSKIANDARGDDRRDRRVGNERPDFKKLPREERPARHDSSRGRGDEGIADLKRQITGLETKLNRILELINPPMPSLKVPLPISDSASLKERKPKKVQAVKKVAPKKVVKKETTKTPVKKVAKKVVAKKVTKKVVKKAVAKKVDKKAKK